MTTVSSLFQMDERQRLAWLMANRGTLIAVGATWIGLIISELVRGRMSLFLIIMVPVFALLRVGLFFTYSSTDFDYSEGAGNPGIARRVKMAAAVLLGLGLLSPLYSFGGVNLNTGRGYGYSWSLISEDPLYSLLLGVAFLWPLATLSLSRHPSPRHVAGLVQVAEPLLAALSVLLLLWIPQCQWQERTFWVFFLGFESARPALGTVIAISANGLYFVVWLWEALRPPPPWPSASSASGVD